MRTSKNFLIWCPSILVIHIIGLVVGISVVALDAEAEQSFLIFSHLIRMRLNSQMIYKSRKHTLISREMFAKIVIAQGP